MMRMAILVVVGVVLAGCGDSGGEGEKNVVVTTMPGGTLPPSTATGPARVLTTAEAEGVALVEALETGVATTLPTGLVVTELESGEGAGARAGQTLVVRYELRHEGKLLESNRDGAPFEFILDAGEVIPGWDQGLMGAKKGSVRELVVPPELGYGVKGSGKVPGGAVLEFRVEVVEVR